MAIERNKELVRLYFEAFNTRNGEIYDQILAADFYVRTLRESPDDIPADDRGPEVFKRRLPSLRRDPFPDGRITIDELVAEEDRVVATWTFQVTHQGVFLGLPPTKRQVIYAGVNGFRIAHDKLVECWDLKDTIFLFQQVGALPPIPEILMAAQAQAKKG